MNTKFPTASRADKNESSINGRTRNENSTASYRGRIFAVSKPGGIRIVHDVQELNAITVRDSALPKRTDNFAEGFVGQAIYSQADLFSGYDGRILAEVSRPLTTFHSILGPLRSCVLPQGYTNAVTEFQRNVDHVLAEEMPEHADGFVDDVGIKGPRSDFDGELVAPDIR